ncbi:hypothetical protein HaLaN_24470, partial [Haematococcus lacustris]
PAGLQPLAAASPHAAASVAGACLPAAAAAVGAAALPPAAPCVEFLPAGCLASVAEHVASAGCQQLAAPSAAGQPAAGATIILDNLEIVATCGLYLCSAGSRRRGHAPNSLANPQCHRPAGRCWMTKGDTLEQGAREQAGTQQLACPVRMQNSRRIGSRLPIAVAKCVYDASEHVACWGQPPGKPLGLAAL